MEHFYESVEGWFDFEALYEEAVRRVPRGAKMAEVGVYKGRSAFFLAVEAFNAEKEISVYAVDRFTWPSDALRQFNDLRQRHKLSNLHIVAADSVTASRTFEDGKLDFVFLDAGHDYEDVAADIRAWWPKVKFGGVLAGHDFCDEFPGVAKAVREFFPELGVVGTGYRIVPPSSRTPGVFSWRVDKL